MLLPSTSEIHFKKEKCITQAAAAHRALMLLASVSLKDFCLLCFTRWRGLAQNSTLVYLVPFQRLEVLLKCLIKPLVLFKKNKTTA